MPEHSLKKYFNVHRRTDVLSVTQTAAIIPAYYSSENANGTVIAKLDCSDTMRRSCWHFMPVKGGYTLVTLPRTLTLYRDSVNGTRDRVTYQKLVTR